MGAYAEPGADIHTSYNDIKIREQLIRADGRADDPGDLGLPEPGAGATDRTADVATGCAGRHPAPADADDAMARRDRRRPGRR
jgi:hypothetical protein